MVKGRILTGAIILVLIVGLVLLLGHLCSQAGVYVTLVNNTPGDITNINLLYTGGTLHVDTLKSKGACHRWVSPGGDSHLEMDWSDSAGGKHAGKVDVYLTRDSGGTIVVTIEPDNRVTWTTDGL